MDLSGIDLSGANLEAANLSGTNLHGANMANAVLTRATFDGADMSGCDLSGANLGDCTLRDTDLSEALLEDTVLMRSTLQGVRLQGARLTGMDFLEVIVADADFSHTHCKQVLFLQSDMQRINFAGAFLEAARFLQVDLRGRRLCWRQSRRSAVHSVPRRRGGVCRCVDGGRYPWRTKAASTGVTFLAPTSTKPCCTSVRWSKADFDGCQLNEANLIKANMRGANLHRMVARKALDDAHQLALGRFARRGHAGGYRAARRFARHRFARGELVAGRCGLWLTSTTVRALKICCSSTRVSIHGGKPAKAGRAL